MTTDKRIVDEVDVWANMRELSKRRRDKPGTPWVKFEYHCSKDGSEVVAIFYDSDEEHFATEFAHGKPN